MAKQTRRRLRKQRGGENGPQTRAQKRKFEENVKPSWGNLAKRYRAPTGRLPRGARLVPTVEILPNVPIADWEQLRDEVMSIPIYLVSCHSALCIDYTQCRTPTRKNTGSEIPSFMIPASTYILNFTAGGEYCLFNEHTSRIARLFQDDFRKLLLINDRDDIGRSTKPQSFVGQTMRAAATEYPNISCTFIEKAGPNELGVFDLAKTSKFVNEQSLIKADEKGPYGDDTWYLDDIIAETYKRTGTAAGIFLFAGCSSPLTGATSVKNLTGAIGRSIEKAQTMIYLAETSYRTLKPTLSLERITEIDPDLIAYNTGVFHPVAQPTPTDAAAYAYATGERLDPNFKKLDPGNFAKSKEILGKK
jgi:hypothetical protein